MTVPLRVRLALVAAALVVAIVAVLGGLVYLQLQADLTGSVDEDLTADPPTGPTVEIAASDIGDVFAAIVGPGDAISATSVGFPTSVVSAHMGTARVTPQRWETTIPSDEGW